MLTLNNEQSFWNEIPIDNNSIQLNINNNNHN